MGDVAKRLLEGVLTIRLRCRRRKLMRSSSYCRISGCWADLRKAYSRYAYNAASDAEGERDRPLVTTSVDAGLICARLIPRTLTTSLENRYLLIVIVRRRRCPLSFP